MVVVMVHIYDRLLLSYKKEETVLFVETWIDVYTIIQSELSLKEKNKYHIISFICGIQKNYTDELICKAEKKTQTQRTNVQIPRGKGEWDELGNWD